MALSITLSTAKWLAFWRYFRMTQAFRIIAFWKSILDQKNKFLTKLIRFSTLPKSNFLEFRFQIPKRGFLWKREFRKLWSFWWEDSSWSELSDHGYWKPKSPFIFLRKVIATINKNLEPTILSGFISAQHPVVPG